MPISVVMDVFSLIFLYLAILEKTTATKEHSLSLPFSNSSRCSKNINNNNAPEYTAYKNIRSVPEYIHGNNNLCEKE